MYDYKKVRKGWIVINTITKQHSHFRSEYGCKCIIRFLKMGVIPDNPYLKESYRRLEGKKKKPKYFNVNKGVRYEKGLPVL